MWLGIITKHGRHVVPHNDLVAHENNRNCICGPKIDDIVGKNRSVEWVYVHESLDRRERNESNG